MYVLNNNSSNGVLNKGLLFVVKHKKVSLVPLYYKGNSGVTC